VTSLIAARDARIDAGDGRRLEGLDFVVESAGRLSIIGDFGPLLALLLGHAALCEGAFELCGLDARAALRAGLVGLAPREWHQPGHIQGRDLLVQSAMLAGVARGAASRSRAASDEHTWQPSTDCTTASGGMSFSSRRNSVLRFTASASALRASQHSAAHRCSDR
jgi:hypothetical protein